MYCKLCAKYPLIVQRYVDNKKLPSITTTAGTRFRIEIVEQHFESSYHIKCKEAQKIDESKNEAHTNKNLIDMHISAANEKRANHIGKLILHVYGDAKKLTSSAYSWPVRSHFKHFKEKIETARASSIHVDGSVDRSQIDKIYIILKIVNAAGDIETLFIGIGQQKERGATGLFNATINGIIDNVGEDIFRLIMSRVSSICTDGENKNTGDNHSLWTLLQMNVKNTEMKCLCLSFGAQLIVQN